VNRNLLDGADYKKRNCRNVLFYHIKIPSFAVTPVQVVVTAKEKNVEKGTFLSVELIFLP
jgi:hypothetical protein